MPKVAIIGGGVIGGGWAARFLLMGWDVAVHEPDPRARERLGRVLADARQAMPGLFDHALPPEGRLEFVPSISRAVAGAHWVQESVPEQMETKRAVLAAIQEASPEAAILASSSSRFTPSALQQGARRPGQILIARPFEPVHLLPLVELAATPANPPALVDRAAEILSDLMMFPLRLGAEVKGHVTGRLVEALRREALRLVREGVTTASGIDEAIRMGPGLLWARQGLSEERPADGGGRPEGPFATPAAPATEGRRGGKTEAAAVAGAASWEIGPRGEGAVESGQPPTSGLERDADLVAMLRALKARNRGAGALLRAGDRRLPLDPVDITRPLVTQRRMVPLDWTDYNGHMNEARYLQAFSDATDRLMEIIGCDAAYIAAGGSYFTVESHIRHLEEIRAGEPFRVETRVLHGRGRKMHLFHEMRHDGDDRLLATGEHFLLHVDLRTRRSSPPAPHVEARLAEIAAAHARLLEPEGVGRAIRRPHEP